MSIGTAEWFTQRGYGFIRPEGGASEDIFAHLSAVERSEIGSLHEGRKVGHDVEQDRGKASACNLGTVQ